MGVYIECPKCKEESINHDDEAFHLENKKEHSEILNCMSCGWVGRVTLKCELEEIELED